MDFPDPSTYASLYVYRELSDNRMAELRECRNCGRIHVRLGKLELNVTAAELSTLADAFNEAVHAQGGSARNAARYLDA